MADDPKKVEQAQHTESSPPGRAGPRHQESPAGAQATPARPPGVTDAELANRESPHGFGQSGAASPALEGAKPSKGRYLLLAPHVIGGHYLPAGTVVGEDTSYPLDVPSNQMVGVDETGKSAVNELHQRLYGRDAPWHDDNHPVMRMQRDAMDARKQQEEDAAAEPVSHQQAFERGHEEFHGEKIVSSPQTRLVSRSLSGDTSQPMGPAPADQNLDNPAVQTRTTQPLKDQMPKEGAAGGGLTAPHKR